MPVQHSVLPSLLVPRHPIAHMTIARRSRRTASGRSAGGCTGMMARLNVVASADQWHMPAHHERIIDRRHQTHAADRQVNGQPSPPRRSRRAVKQRSRRSARSGSSRPRKGKDHRFLGGIHHRHLVICGHALFMWARLSSRDFRRVAVDPADDRRVAIAPELINCTRLRPNMPDALSTGLACHSSLSHRKTPRGSGRPRTGCVRCREASTYPVSKT